VSISIHGPTAVDGTYNVIGIENRRFFLQGNLTEAQLKELAKEIKAVLKK
jgi:galactose-1-phosphate uridylyltransferase